MNSADYKVESVSIEKAFADKDSYPYALLYCYSNVKLCRTSDLSESDLDECREARFFGPEAELHVLAEENRAVLVTETGQGAVLDKVYELSKRFTEGRGCGKVRQYLKADEDGQMKVVLTRLADVQGGL